MTPWLAEAAGLGKITVLSNLGQPLRAEVEVSASREELAGMMARLAPLDAFRQASIDYANGLSDLRFSLEKRPNGTSIIRVTSSKPVNEPFLDFLVELNWPTGRLVREYTFLLDPPEVAAKSAGKAISVAEAKPVTAVRGGNEVEASVPAKAAAKEAPAPTRAELKPKVEEKEAKKADSGNTRVVKQGDTLRKIASEAQYEGVSLEQMLVGLFRANSDAFIGANINRMRAGAILTIPEKETVASIPESEAKKEYRAQSADWNAYRKKLAAAAAQGPAKDEAGGQAAGGKITAKIDEKIAPAEAQKDQVKVTRSDANAKGAGKGGAVSEEAAIAKDKALKEAQERLAMLEKNVSELQKLVEMKNQRLAELQKQAAAPKPEAPKPVEPPKAAESPKPVEPVKAPEAPKAVEAPKPVEPPKAEEAAKPVEPPKVADAPKPVEPPKAVDSPKQVEAPKPAEPRKVAPPPEPEPESDFLDEFMLPLAGGGGILALLGGFIFYKRRRSSSAPVNSSTAAPNPSSLGPNSVFRATGGQSVDTGNTTPQSTDFSQTGPGTIDTDEVDPVAEADVYMAYGRDAQAEEILLEALQKDPQRTAIHAKLLEIYAGRKSLKQFETLAGELYAQTGGVGAEWEKVAAMGAKLDPDNPLYSGARTAVGGVEAFDADATMIVSPADALKATAVIPGALSQLAEGAAAGEVPSISDLDAAEPVVQAPMEEAKAADSELMSLDFDLDSAAPAAVPAVEPESPVSEPVVADAAADAPADVLDFDLGTVTSPEPLTANELAVPEEMPEIEQAGSLDFDLGLGDQPEASFSTTVEMPVVAAEEAVETIGGDIDAMVDTLVGPEALEIGKAAREAKEAAENMVDFELDIGSPGVETLVEPDAIARAEEAPASAVEEDVVDLGAVDTDALEFDVKLTDSTVLGQPMQAPSFDMTSINLDLGAEPALSEAGLETQVMPDPSVFEAPEPVEAESQTHATDALWEEVNTKLDLAKAYEEMGDLEGARELLQEVANEGPADLVEQAQAILQRLNG